MSITLIAAPGSPKANSYVSLDAAGEFFQARYGYAAWAALSNDDRAQLLITASGQVDTLRYYGTPVFTQGGYTGQAQAMKFPRVGHRYFQGNLDAAASDVSGIMSELSGYPEYIDDFWKYGAIVILSGAQQRAVRAVAGFIAATSTLTYDTFGDDLGAVQALLIAPLPQLLRDAICLQAWHLYEQGTPTNPRRNLQADGVAGYSLPGISETFVSPKASGQTVMGPLCVQAYELLNSAQIIDRTIDIF